MIEKRSIYSYLLNREIQPSIVNELYDARQLYTKIVPNQTVYDISERLIIPKRFTSDGKYLICISRLQHSVQVYYYHSSNVAEKCSRFFGSSLHDHKSNNDYTFDLHFNDFFTLKYELVLVHAGELICKDFCLFTDDKRFMILASASPNSLSFMAPGNNSLSQRRNPASLNYTVSLDDVTFHIIDIEEGKVAFTKTFEGDSMYLSHQSNVSLYGSYLAITSIQHQNNGHLLFVTSVGAYLFPEDQHILGSNNDHRDYKTICGLRHRFLAFIYKACLASDNSTNDVRQFFSNFNRLSSLIIGKCQFIDANHLLIKFGTPEYIIARQNKYQYQLAYFIIYNIQTTEIIAILNTGYEETLHIYLKYSDCFRPFYSIDAQPIPYISSVSNNEYEREIFLNFIHAVQNSKSLGSLVPIIRRLTSRIPYQAQSSIESPYFDHNFFNYDDKLISVSDRPKMFSDYPIKFYLRDSELPLFKFYIGLPPDYFHAYRSGKHKKVSTVVAHPFEPLIISMLSISSEQPIINIHYRL